MSAVTPVFVRLKLSATSFDPLKATPTALPSPVILKVQLFASTVAVSALPLKLVANTSFNFTPLLPIS